MYLAMSGILREVMQSLNNASGPSERTIAASVLWYASEFPRRPAVVFGTETINYMDLWLRACEIARALKTGREAGLDRVAIHLPIGVDRIAAILGCQILGVSYVPVEPNLPESRIREMLAQVDPSVLLSSSAVYSAILKDVSSGSAVMVEEIGVGAAGAGSSDRDVALSPNSSGYVIFTSGSTGKPKAVDMGGAALQNLVNWQIELSSLSGNGATAQFAPISFDVSFQEIFSTLCSGGRIVILTNEQRIDPDLLSDEIQRAQVERLFLPFIALQQLASNCVERKQFPDSLREIHTAGEQLVVSSALREFFSKLPECRLFNQYGPSETHVVTCHELDSNPAEWPRLPPIGRVLPNVELFILDEDARPVRSREVGELYVGGICLAQGYFQDKERTEERFVTIDINGTPTRLYRTGDFATSDESGCFFFCGRRDHQIKIDGYRVELGEIESVIADHPDVAEVAMVFERDANGMGRLIACLTSKDQAPTDCLETVVRAHVRKMLPSYMAPDRVQIMSAMPKTASGKVDRKSIAEKLFAEKVKTAAPPVEKAASATTSGSTKSGDLCGAITSHWRELLDHPSLADSDNVFDFGARSIMVPELQRRLRRQFGINISAILVFRHPSPRGLADYLSRNSAKGDASNTTLAGLATRRMSSKGRASPR
ncbi:MULTISPECIES: amino acid adenylation domain-containing protein [unclassified Mesorhizobium]|uniref:amino acid adenylation domain-containing protein n=1 Tax=unclassified Mesorhizobium TaxID=325217 RepID=UPI001FE0E589|nr:MULTISPECIES: amino acid adenylation domain-containing protein [unclassified Mesorhizobium]